MMRTHNLFGSTFCGVPMQQYWADLPLWEGFLNSHDDVETIVELGTFEGGMALYLAAQAEARGLDFWTFDKKEPQAIHTALGKRLRLHAKFVLGDYFAETQSSGELLSLLTDACWKPLLLFVDGGRKNLEFKRLVPFLSHGDYVAVHDYGTEFAKSTESELGDAITREYWEQCEAPPRPSLLRFWRRA